MAQLLVDVLAENRRKRRFLLHEFVIMPNHIHLLLTPAAEIPLQKAPHFMGVSGIGIGRPATRAKALNLCSGALSRVETRSPGLKSGAGTT
jgi:REP element-mobilizing transposase RayT